MIVVFLLSYAYSPRAYSVSNGAIIVKRLIGNVRVPPENLRVLRKIEKDDLRGCMRLWGSGGLFGYYGLFRTSKLGRCTWYATNRKKLVVAIGEKTTTVLSPDDVDSFFPRDSRRGAGAGERTRTIFHGRRRRLRGGLYSGKPHRSMDRNHCSDRRGVGYVGRGSCPPACAQRDSLKLPKHRLAHAVALRLYSGCTMPHVERLSWHRTI